MTRLDFVALVLALLGPVLALARLLRAPPTLVLFTLGLASTQLPGLPAVQVEPELLTSLFLPPLLYASTVRVTWHLLRFNLLRGVVAGTLLSIATILAVAMLARLLLPHIGWPAALLLGVVAALFDTRLFHEAKGRPHVPRAMADTLKTREMVARVVALSAFMLTLGALEAAEVPAFGAAALMLIWSLLGGAAAGLAIGWAVMRLRARAEPAPVEIAVSIATPYLCALAAGWLGLSVIVAVMAAALVVSAARVDRETGALATSAPEARISAVAFWEEASLLLSSLLYFLAGRALPEALAALGELPLWQTASAAAAILVLVLGLQFVVDLVSVPVARRRPVAAAVMSWASTRSVIGLIVALSVPAELPGGGAGFAAQRDLILVVATFAVLGSTLLQGLTLASAVRAAALSTKEEADREEELATRAGAEAAAEGGAHARADAARRAALQLREEDRIGDEALHKALREVDLQARASQGTGAALPGAGPPNP